MEELINLKKYIKGSFEELADGLKECFDNLDEGSKSNEKKVLASLDNIREKVGTVENIGAHKPVINPEASNKASKSKPEEPPHPTVNQQDIGPPEHLSRPAKKEMMKKKKKKTRFLAKPKILFIGDSVAHNTEFLNLENETNTRIHSVKAYSSVKDRRARWPHKNFADVTPAALCKTQQEDVFTKMVLSAPTVDISNIDVSKANPQCEQGDA